MATLEMVDTPGLSRSHEGSAARLAMIREAGCLVIVVAAFDGNDPAADLQRFEEDLLIADLDIVSGRIERRPGLHQETASQSGRAAARTAGAAADAGGSGTRPVAAATGTDPGAATGHEGIPAVQRQAATDRHQHQRCRRSTRPLRVRWHPRRRPRSRSRWAWKWSWRRWSRRNGTRSVGKWRSSPSIGIVWSAASWTPRDRCSFSPPARRRCGLG